MEIKPCPFCGGVNIDAHRISISTNNWLVSCDDCLTEGPIGITKEGAIVLWNERVCSCTTQS